MMVFGSFARSIENARGALAAALLAAMAGCAGGPAQTAAPDSELPRIVSLNPCLDAMLVEVAEPGQILALSHYSRDPASSSIDREVASRYAVIGGAVEEVLALDPDLVLASAFLAPATRQALTDLGIKVASFGVAATPDASLEQVREIALLTGQTARGEALAARITHALEMSRPPAGAKPLSAVLWQPGQIVPGEATLVSHLMRHTGFTSHSAARGLGQADYLPLEAMLADPPDVVLVAGNARGQHHPALAQLGETTSVEFDPSLLYCGGPTIIRAAERLAEIRDGAA